MTDPKDKTPQSQPDATPEASEQEVVTNAEEAGKIVNTDEVPAEEEAAESPVSEAQPDTALNTDTAITNTDDANGDEPVVN
ncbi:hypothetical protein BC343_24240 [Mucilaginibacter pedocola]|uniref:Uncharacterized protein n=2 Tax=Mucilaginibacter pedocola TaxID=1792845 RepID=A0A1S9PIC8_9SPHI|nr:hypothetical protein BC343_24240 [Mucilaginibacter pedocola]